MKNIRHLLGCALIATVGALPSISSATPVLGPVSLKVDLGLTGQDIQSGFIGLSGISTATSATGFGTGSSSEISFTIEGTGSAMGFRDRATPATPNMTGVLGDLLEDFYFANSQIKLTFSGLTAGNYSLTSWFHDAEYSQSQLKIDVNSVDLLTGIGATTGFSPTSIGVGTVNFYSDGLGGDVVLFIETAQVRNTNSAVILNGFSLQSVPEPASIALLGLGLVGVAVSRKRKQN